MADEYHKLSGTLVVGLGRFGSAVATTMDSLDHEILAVERNPSRVQRLMGRFPLVEADATSMEALEQLGARQFASAVVGVGSSLEASVLITANLVELGVPNIWAKATSREHGKILKRIGAHHVVYPEFDAGIRAAHLVSGRMIDYLQMDRFGFAVMKLHPPKEVHGFTIGELDLRGRYGVNILGVISPDQPFEYATPTTRIHPEDTIIVSGDTKLLEAFAARP